MIPDHFRPVVTFGLPCSDNVEDPNEYATVGGHLAVNLGDILHLKYKIIHKLGHGGFGLVWLARDLDQNRNVALKISKGDADCGHEIQILRHLNTVTDDSRIPTLHDKFVIDGMNGLHQCMVLDPGGPSLKLLELRSHVDEGPYTQLGFCSPQTRLSFFSKAAQNVSGAVAALHSAGVCHGDLTPSNVLFRIPGLRGWTEAEIYQNLGYPKMEPVLDMDKNRPPPYAPAYVVASSDYSSLPREELSATTLLVDFGQAFFAPSPPKDLGTPASFYAPELLFEYAPSPAVDLWALGCLIFEMMASWTLLPTFFNTSDEGLGMAIETMGALPEGWRERWYDRQKRPLVDGEDGTTHRWFDESVEREREVAGQVLKRLPELSESQREGFVRLIKSLVVFEPEKRMPAGDVAGQEWFREMLEEDDGEGETGVGK